MESQFLRPPLDDSYTLSGQIYSGLSYYSLRTYRISHHRRDGFFSVSLRRQARYGTLMALLQNTDGWLP